MRPLRWTCSSAARLSRELQGVGHRVSERSVNRLLHALGYSLQANRKTLEGKQHPDRDAHFVEHFGAVNNSLKRADAREFFEELQRLCGQQLQDCGEFTLPGIAKLVLQKREARTGRNPATGEAIEIPSKQVVKARIAKQLKDAVLPEA